MTVDTMATFLAQPDPAQLATLLSDEIRFHSPVADYEGRADVSHLLITITEVLGTVDLVREIWVGRERTTFLAGTVEGRPIQAVLDEHHDAHGRVVEATLMMRPLSVLHHAVRAMADALAASPLPSRA